MGLASSLARVIRNKVFQVFRVGEASISGTDILVASRFGATDTKVWLSADELVRWMGLISR